MKEVEETTAVRSPPRQKLSEGCFTFVDKRMGSRPLQ
jgi:hypothetical protein